MIKELKTYKAVDLFCGAGGMSTGAEQSGRVNIALAINHCRTAVFSHRNNHPDTRHICARVEDMNIRDDETIPDDLDALFAGIECVFHSNARGSAPIDDQRRSSAWRVLDWMEAKRFDVCVFENVREFLDWGPIDANRRKIKSKRGQIFEAWKAAIESLGYTIDWKILNAADFGAATKRLRLFIQCRRDGKPIRWPEPRFKERPKTKPYKQGVHWKPAHEIIDWTKNCPSIFDRKKMLVDKTLRRIRIGLLKFVQDAPAPFIVSYHGGKDPNRDGTKRQHPISQPLPTIDTQPRFAVCEPYGVNMKGQSDAFDVNNPAPTITAGAAHNGVAQPYLVKLRGTNDAEISNPVPTITAGGQHLGVSQPFLVPQFGERESQVPRTHDVNDALPTVTSHGAGALVQPFTLDIHGENWTENSQRSIEEPMTTVTAKPGNSLATPFVIQNGGSGLNDERYDATFDASNPIPTVIGKKTHGVVQPYMVDVNHGDSGSSRTNDTSDPLGTLTTRRGKAVSVPYLVKFYGTATVASVQAPCPTVTAKDRFALAIANQGFGKYPKGFVGPVIPIFKLENQSREMGLLVDTMTRLGVYDIGFRMLDCDELAKAQGFPIDYDLHGSKKEQMRQIGNAVCPPVMKSICEVL